MTDSQYLVQLETILDEFFSSDGTNHRKYEIEQILGTFSHQTNTWQLCSYFLTHSQNTHVLMFSLNVYETLANSMWPGKHSLTSTISIYVYVYRRIGAGKKGAEGESNTDTQIQTQTSTQFHYKQMDKVLCSGSSH